MISVRAFLEKFPDERACRDLLLRLRWKQGFICPRCGDDKHSVIRTRKLFECSSCHAQTSVTAGTAMHRTKLPLRYWMFVFYWVASGHRCSARQLSLQLKLNYRTALRMLHAVRQSMGRATGGARFAFWTVARHSFIQQVNRSIGAKADRYIRNHYRHTSERKRTSYYFEFRFHQAYGYSPSHSLRVLLRASAATIWDVCQPRIRMEPAPTPTIAELLIDKLHALGMHKKAAS